MAILGLLQFEVYYGKLTLRSSNRTLLTSVDGG